jgi:hypothetical protein
MKSRKIKSKEIRRCRRIRDSKCNETIKEQKNENKGQRG